MTSSSAVFSRTHSLVFLCASLLGSSSTSQLCRDPEASLPPCHDPHRLACWVILRPHNRSRSLLHPGSRVHVLLVTARGSAASSVVVDLGFCDVSMTDLRFSSDQLFSANRRTLRAYTTPSSVRTRCSSARSLFPSHTPDFPLYANFGAGLPDPFPTSGRSSFPRLRSAHGTIERETARQPRKRGLSQAACRTIHLIKALSAVGL